MRTTLDIDEDVLQAAKELATAHKTTAGRVLSALARKGLQPPREANRKRHGVPLLPPQPDERPVTNEIVDRLRDQS